MGQWRFSTVRPEPPVMQEGVNGVNRLATKGGKILLTTDKTRKKLPTGDKKKSTEIYRQPTKVENFNRQPTK